MKSQCEFLEKHFDGYCNGTLTADEKLQYEEHVSSCRFCEEEIAVYTKTKELVEKVSPPSVSDSFWREQHDAIVGAMTSVRQQADWVAPRFSLVLMLVMVGVYMIDGIGCVYVSGSYFSNVMSHISNSISGQFFDPSLLLYLAMAAIGIFSFVSEPQKKQVRVSGRRTT